MLRSLTDGSISGTGTIESQSQIVGAIALSTDGTNAGTVVLRKDDSLGDVIYSISGKEAMHIPISLPVDADVWHYSITGTGCTAQVFEQAI